MVSSWGGETGRVYLRSLRMLQRDYNWLWLNRNSEWGDGEEENHFFLDLSLPAGFSSFLLWPRFSASFLPFLSDFSFSFSSSSESLPFLPGLAPLAFSGLGSLDLLLGFSSLTAPLLSLLQASRSTLYASSYLWYSSSILFLILGSRLSQAFLTFSILFS